MTGLGTIGGLVGEVTASSTNPDDEWARWFYSQSRHGLVKWRGVQLLKHPLDMIIYAEVIHEVMPRVLIETGTRQGGSALFFADMMAAGGVPDPRVISVDLYPGSEVIDPRIHYVAGSSVDEDILDQVHILAVHRKPVMVTLDSDHSPEHVYAELEAYHHWVTPGSYLIVEDTDYGGNPIDSPNVGDGEGPLAAVKKWLPEHPEFVADRSREKFGVSFNPGGWLRRIA